MKKVVLKILNVEESEAKVLAYLALQSIFLGIFYGSFDIGANTLFLNNFDKSFISKGFIFSGLVGILLTTVYTRLQKTISFARLSLYNLTFLVVISAILRIGLDIFNGKWWIFIVFVMQVPTNTLGTINFWGMASRLFSLRQGKRLFGLVGAGVLAGIIISCYLTPLAPVLTGTNLSTNALLVIGVIGIFIALIIQTFIVKNFNLGAVPTKSVRVKKLNIRSIFAMFADKYVMLLAIFVIFSVVIFYFLQYNFLAVTNQKYTDSKDLAAFLGVYTGTLQFFSLMIRAFLYNKLINTYGVRICLLLLPFLLVFFGIIAVLVAVLAGYKDGTAGFIFYFLLIALARLFAKALRDSVEAPSFKLFFQSLPSSIRFTVQSTIEGTVGLFASLFAGILLYILSAFKFFDLVHYTFIILLFVILWLLIIKRLYVQYRSSLERSLANAKYEHEYEEELDKSELSNKLFENVSTRNPDKIITSLEILEVIEPIEFERFIISLISHPQEQVRLFAVRKLSEKGIYNAISILAELAENDESEIVKKETTKVLNRMKKVFDKKFTPEKILKYIKSVLPEQRELAARVIGATNDKEMLPYLMLLLRNFDPQVRNASILAAAHLAKPELATLLVDNLLSPIHRSATVSALVAIGNPSLDALEQIFYKSNIDKASMIQILRIYGLIGGERAKNLLITKIDHQYRDVGLEACKSLKKCNFTPESIVELQIIKHAIETTIHITAWNLAAYEYLPDNLKEDILGEALQEEIENNYDQIYLLLSLAYDPQSIEHVRQNIESGTTEGIGFALELLDLFVAEELKPILFPLLEDTTSSERILLLQNFYPLSFTNLNDLLLAIINRDSNYLGRWAKACAIKSISERKLSNDLIAQMFNQDTLLCQVAANYISDTDNEYFTHFLRRFTEKRRTELEFFVEKKISSIFDKVLFLKKNQFLKNISSDILIQIAENLEYTKIKEESVLMTGFSKADSPLVFSIVGEIVCQTANTELVRYKNHHMISSLLIKNSEIESVSIIAKPNSEIFLLNRTKLNELLFDYPELINSIIGLAETRYEN